MQPVERRRRVRKKRGILLIAQLQQVSIRISPRGPREPAMGGIWKGGGGGGGVLGGGGGGGGLMGGGWWVGGLCGLGIWCCVLGGGVGAGGGG